MIKEIILVDDSEIDYLLDELDLEIEGYERLNRKKS